MQTFLLTLLAILIIGLQPAMAHKTGKRHSHYKRHHKTNYYYDQKSRSYNTDATRPNAANGDNTKSNDGQKKNKQRNLNYQSGQALPSNSGGK